MDRQLSTFVCALYIIVGLAALGLLRELVGALAGVLALAAVASIFWGISWVLTAWPVSRPRQAPPVAKVKPPKKKKPTPQWLKILEDDDEED